MHAIKPIQIACFGRLSVRVHGKCIAVHAWNSRKVYQFLLLLVASAGQRLSSSVICDRLWPDHEADKAHQNLEFTLRRLRQLIQKPLGKNIQSSQVIPLQQGKISLNRDYCDIDCCVLQHAMQQSKKLRRNEAHQQAYLLEQQMITMIQGAFLQGENELVYHQRQTCHQRICNWIDETVKHWRNDAGITLHQLTDLLDVGLHIDPYSERLLCQRIEILHQAGYQADAICHYQRWAGLLLQRFSVNPSQSTQQVYQRIAAG